MVADADPVRAETFEDFVVAEQGAIAELLKDQERWARANIDQYPALPEGLTFSPGGTPAELRLRLLRALRVNPTMPLSLYIQQIPGLTYDRHFVPMHAWNAMIPYFREQGHVPTLAVSELLALRPAGALQPLPLVRPLDVLLSASDEPDYGLDIGLWEDNGTPYGKEYGFGPQPLGNGEVVFSSQAPFHMGFFHESPLIYAFRGSLRRMYPELRMHQFTSLAKLAFHSGHAYWGWRFLGWAMHYIQDLTQPYHATPLPGKSTAAILWAAIRDILGNPKPVERIVQLATNRHFTLEKFQYESLARALRQRDESDRYVMAIRDDKRDRDYPAYSDSYVRNVVTRDSCDIGKSLSKAILGAFPKRWVNDATYVWDEAEMDQVSSLEAVTREPKKRESIDAMLEELLARMAAHSRNLARATVEH